MTAAVIWVVASVVGAPFIGAFIRAGTSTPTPSPPFHPHSQDSPAMTTVTPTATERIGQITDRVKARRFTKRQLVAAVARAEYLLEVRTAGAGRLVQHNAQLEAELRAALTIPDGGRK